MKKNENPNPKSRLNRAPKSRGKFKAKGKKTVGDSKPSEDSGDSSKSSNKGKFSKFKKPFKKKPEVPEREQKFFHVYKPFGMLSQFSKEGEYSTLGDLELDFPRNVYPVGRLDKDSEGLLLLTNDRRMNNSLLDPTNKHEKEYWVQVEGQADQQALNKLKNGPIININGKKHQCLPCKVRRFSLPQWVPDRNPPIRKRANIPTTWLSITIVEGKNRQVRKMTAAVGLPTLRLVRYRIKGINIEKMAVGEINEWNKKDIYRVLFD